MFETNLPRTIGSKQGFKTANSDDVIAANVGMLQEVMKRQSFRFQHDE